VSEEQLTLSTHGTLFLRALLLEPREDAMLRMLATLMDVQRHAYHMKRVIAFSQHFTQSAKPIQHMAGLHTQWALVAWELAL
jgi:hypothetical protein